MDTKVGIITHYYDKVGVGIVKLDKPLSVGDTVKITGHEHEFTQKVTSLQFDHKTINSGSSGQEVGLKVDQKVKEKDEVYKVE